ncbi:MAG TPA: flagellar biosynthetic protein FliQ [Candidatus Dormibacteraeota bacterium]|nr:flagellar biosynthetic protein FliQ [Candidatus Dormibacteraeota bacterium]
MTEIADGLARHALVICALLALPTLAVSATVGLAVALLQAATQVQEQTIAMLPKLIAAGTIVALGGGFGLEAVAALFHDALHAIPLLVSAP